MLGGTRSASAVAARPAVGPATPATPGGHRRADVQGLRALAVLLVVAVHADLPVPGGYVGVDVFFVISGFVITLLLEREIASTGGLSFRTFAARRVRRILPALALTVAVVTILALAAISPEARTLTGRTGLAGSFFVANAYLAGAPLGYFDLPATANPLLHIWSLSVEEQFYLVFPTLLLGATVAARRLGARRRVGVAGVVAVVAAGSLLLCIEATAGGVTLGPMHFDAQDAFYLAPMRAWEFATGALLALGAARVARLPRVLALPIAISGVALVAIAAFGFDAETPFPGSAAIVPVVGTVLLIAAGTVGANPVSRALSWRPVTAIGDASYSIYLWHWPLIVFAVALFPMEERAPLAGALLAFIPAWLSFRFVETPLRLDPRLRGRRVVTLAVVCVAVPALTSLVLLRAPDPPQSDATRALLRVGEEIHADAARGCNHGDPIGTAYPRCVWSAPDPHGWVALLGDSNAGQLVEPVARAANGLGLSLSVATYRDCPIVDIVVRNPRWPETTGRCRRFVTESVDRIIARRPNLVILAASGPIYLTSATEFDAPGGGRATTDPEGKAALWAEGLERVLARLDRAGIPTVVVHTIPQWRTWDSRTCATLRVHLAPRSCGATQTRAEAERFLADSRAATERALAAVPSTTALDLTDDLCPDGECRTNRGDRWIYRDGRHLSVAGALGLTDRFVEVIEERT